jgi:enoyl-CoA hydratase/carnithine racemase
MMLTGELLTAEQALALGLINHVAEDGRLEQKAEEALGQLRQMSVPALEMTRRAIMQSQSLGFDEALKVTEDIYLNQLMSYKDPQEGVDAFIAKRPPRWRHK